MEKFNQKLYGRAQFKNRPKQVYYAYARIIRELFEPSATLDLGCACGYALDWWNKQGITVSGVEPARAAYRFMPNRIKSKVKHFDLRLPQHLKQFDLVNCTEVGEHIEAKFEKILLKNIALSVKNFLILSWSGEQNREHVNPRSQSYIKFRLHRLGLYFEPELTWQLRQKLAGPVFRHWRHWQKNILVFSRTPQHKRVLIRHYEWLPSYANKNVGYFMDLCRVKGFGPRWGNSLFGHWHRVWLYPFEKHLLVKLLILKLFGNQIILKMDSVILPDWKAWLSEKLCAYILVESSAVAGQFRNINKLVFFSGGLPWKNLKLIKSLKLKKEKIILYCGRQTKQKGFDRLKSLIPCGWRLKIATDLPPEKYYREILRSSLVILPTRGEGWPNVFKDAWFCRRLFLTTNKSKCAEGIKDKTFFTADLSRSVKKITQNSDYYYRHFDQLYDRTKFGVTDKVFLSLIKNKG